MSMINPKINMHKIIKNRDNSRENQFNKQEIREIMIIDVLFFGGFGYCYDVLGYCILVSDFIGYWIFCGYWEYRYAYNTCDIFFD